MTVPSRFTRPALVCLLATGAALPCGPFLSSVSLVPLQTPDGDLRAFAGGRIGLVAPLFRSEFLAVAYRWWSGVELDAIEQKAIADHWSPEPMPAWEAVRKLVREQPLPVKAEDTDPQTRQARQVIGDHAQQLAALTLQARIARFGARSPEVSAWLDAQDLVFQRQIPPEAPATLPLLIRQDRAYQRAAGHFYLGHLDEAAAAFDRIAEDKTSPWQAWSRFMGARCRQEHEPEAAIARLRAILKAAAPAEVHLAAGQLLERLEDAFGENLAACQLAMGERLMARGRGPRLAQDLTNLRFTYVAGVDALASEAGKAGAPEPDAKRLDPARKGLVGWIHMLWNGKADAAIAGYQAQAGSPEATPWLLAVLMKLEEKDPRVPEFLELARKHPWPASAYATAAVHRSRLLLATGRAKAARALLDEALVRPELQTPSGARNVLLSLRLRTVTTPEAFLAHLERHAVSTSWDPTQEEPLDPKLDARALDPAAADAFNRDLPLATWKDLLDRPAFPAGLRNQVLQAGWVRAVLLGQDDLARTWTEAMAQAHPSEAAALRAWKAEPDPRRRRFLALQLLWAQDWWPWTKVSPLDELEYRRTWWGPVPTHLSGTEGGLMGGRLDLPWLDATQKATALREAAQLAHTSPLTWFCREALAFAEAFPEDPMAPEALSWAVRASRAAYRDDASAGLLLKAFRHLHKTYPKSAGAAKAKVYH